VVKRRFDKRRVSPEREFEVWSAVFDTGYDFFDELPELGFPRQGHGKINPDLAREPWRRFGARWLAERENERRVRPLWALEEFGEP
jgi:hypothetical protein